MLPVSQIEDTPPQARVLPRLAALWGLAVGTLAVHNIEEWLLDLTGWMADRPWLPGGALHGDQTRFTLALLTVTALFAGTAIVAVLARPRWSAGVLACAAYALVANGVSHIVMSLVSRDPMPGLFTGALLLVPAGLVIIRRLPPVRWTLGAVLITVGAALALVFGSLGLAAALTP